MRTSLCAYNTKGWLSRNTKGKLNKLNTVILINIANNELDPWLYKGQQAHGFVLIVVHFAPSQHWDKGYFFCSVHICAKVNQNGCPLHGLNDINGAAQLFRGTFRYAMKKRKNNSWAMLATAHPAWKQREASKNWQGHFGKNAAHQRFWTLADMFSLHEQNKNLYSDCLGI